MDPYFAASRNLETTLHGRTAAAGAGATTATNGMLVLQPPRCSVYPELPADYYCVDCQAFVSSHAHVRGAHRNHYFLTVREAAELHVPAMRAWTDRCQEQLRTAERVLGGLSAACDALDRAQSSESRRIDAAYDAIVAALARQRHTLQAQLRGQAATAQREAADAWRRVDDLVAYYGSYQEHCAALLSNVPPVDAMDTATVMWSADVMKTVELLGSAAQVDDVWLPELRTPQVRSHCTAETIHELLHTALVPFSGADGEALPPVLDARPFQYPDFVTRSGAASGGGDDRDSCGGGAAATSVSGRSPFYSRPGAPVASSPSPHVRRHQHHMADLVDSYQRYGGRPEEGDTTATTFGGDTGRGLRGPLAFGTPGKEGDDAGATPPLGARGVSAIATIATATAAAAAETLPPIELVPPVDPRESETVLLSNRNTTMTRRPHDQAQAEGDGEEGPEHVLVRASHLYTAPGLYGWETRIDRMSDSAGSVAVGDGEEEWGSGHVLAGIIQPDNAEGEGVVWDGAVVAGPQDGRTFTMLAAMAHRCRPRQGSTLRFILEITAPASVTAAGAASQGRTWLHCFYDRERVTTVELPPGKGWTPAASVLSDEDQITVRGMARAETAALLQQSLSWTGAASPPATAVGAESPAPVTPPHRSGGGAASISPHSASLKEILDYVDRIKRR